MRRVRTIVEIDEASEPGSMFRSRFVIWFTIIAGLTCVACIWVWPFLPSVNYPIWIHDGQVFSQLLRHQAAFCYGFVHFPVPNSIFVVTIGLLDLILAPETSGKVFLSLYVLLFILGSYRLVSSMTTRRDSPLLLLPLLFVFQRCIWQGEISFGFSLPLLFFAVAYVLKAPSQLKTHHYWVFAGFSVFLFFSHAIAYMCWLTCLAMFVFFDARRVMRLKTLAAISPSLALMILYVTHRVAPKTAQDLAFPSVVGQLRSTTTFFSAFSPLRFFDPFYLNDPRWFIWLAFLFNFTIVAMVLALSAIWLAKFRRLVRQAPQSSTVRAMFATPALLFAIFLVVPLDALTGVEDVNYRLLLPAFLLILAGLLADSQPRLFGHTQWVLSGAAACAVAVVLAFQCFYVGHVAQELGAIHEELIQAHLPPDFRELVYNQFELYVPPPALYSTSRLVPVHDSLRYLAEYVRTENGLPGRVFTTSVIGCSVSYAPLMGKNQTLTLTPSAIVILGHQTYARKLAALVADQYLTMVDQPYMLFLQRKSNVNGGLQNPPCLGHEVSVRSSHLDRGVCASEVSTCF